MPRKRTSAEEPEFPLPAPPEMEEELKRDEEAEEEEAEEEAEDFSALGAAQQSQQALEGGGVDDLFATFNPGDEEDGMEDWNDPSVTHLDPVEPLGGRTRETELFGETASGPMGRSTSPRLYAQVAQFPTCTQLRVWKWENGIPVGLGVIDSQASEEDLIHKFVSAMPKEGEGRCQFKLRPIDITGQEMGQEVNLMISEHHGALQTRRRMGYEDEDSDEDAITAASEMTRMFDRMMMTSEQKSRALEEALEEERRRLREQDAARAEERVSLANESARGVQVLTERMMQDEARRNESAVKMQNEQNQTMVTTLTSIFAQQQQMMQGSMEAARRSDEYRLEQERQRAHRERDEEVARRERERRESDERFRREKEESESKMRQERSYMEARMIKEQKEMEYRLQREREESARKHQREREEREARDRWLAEERGRRDQMEREATREREGERQRRHERMVSEAQAASQRDREHAERMMTLSKIEMSNQAFGGLGEMLPKAKGFLKDMGMDPAEVMQRVLGQGQDEGSGTTELITSLLGVAGEVAKTAIASKNAPLMMPPPMAPPMLTQVPQMMEQPSAPPPNAQAAYAMPGPTDQAPSEVQTTPATGAGLSLQDQKKARNSLRKMIQILGTKPREEWDEIILSVLAAEPAIYGYVQAVTVRTALYEANASDYMVVEVMRGLRESPLVPHDLAYGDQ